jgi:hypothetical protein
MTPRLCLTSIFTALVEIHMLLSWIVDLQKFAYFMHIYP